MGREGEGEKKVENTAKHQPGLHSSDIYPSERLQTSASLKPAHFPNQQSNVW